MNDQANPEELRRIAQDLRDYEAIHFPAYKPDPLQFLGKVIGAEPGERILLRLAKVLDPMQMTLDLFPEERKSPLDMCVEWLEEVHGCDRAKVAPICAELFRIFGRVEGFDRAKVLTGFYGRHATPRLQACPPRLMGLFDKRLDYHTVWDRCWAAKWVPLREAIEVREWRYGTRKDGRPMWVWYVDMEGREVKRPYEEE